MHELPDAFCTELIPRDRSTVCIREAGNQLPLLQARGLVSHLLHLCSGARLGRHMHTDCDQIEQTLRNSVELAFHLFRRKCHTCAHAAALDICKVTSAAAAHYCNGRVQLRRC